MTGHYLVRPTDLTGFAMPDLQGEWREYWEGTARGELLIQSCPHCGAKQFYPRVICVTCGRDPEWMKASGLGTLHTFSISRQNAASQFAYRLPYVVGIVDLDEGVRMMSNIIECNMDDVKIGMRLKVTFVDAEPSVSIPFWSPA